jgi:hypothetical protein
MTDPAFRPGRRTKAALHPSADHLIDPGEEADRGDSGEWVQIVTCRHNIVSAAVAARDRTSDAIRLRKRAN